MLVCVVHRLCSHFHNILCLDKWKVISWRFTYRTASIAHNRTNRDGSLRCSDVVSIFVSKIPLILHQGRITQVPSDNMTYRRTVAWTAAAAAPAAAAAAAPALCCCPAVAAVVVPMMMVLMVKLPPMLHDEVIRDAEISAFFRALADQHTYEMNSCLLFASLLFFHDNNKSAWIIPDEKCCNQFLRIMMHYWWITMLCVLLIFMIECIITFQISIDKSW